MSEMHFGCGLLMVMHWFGHSRWLDYPTGQFMRHYITKMGTRRRPSGLREAFGMETIFTLARHDIITTGTFSLASMALNEVIYCLPLNTTDIYCVLSHSDPFLSRSRFSSCLSPLVLAFLQGCEIQKKHLLCPIHSEEN